ncbi:MAG: NifU family protein [Actinomycetota bacterium]
MNESEQATPVSDDERIASTARTVLDLKVKPFIQAHGGSAEVVAVDHGRVEVRMSAACGNCELKDVTFASRIRAELLTVPGVTEVVCAQVPLGAKHLDRIAAFFFVPSLSARPAHSETHA